MIDFPLQVRSADFQNEHGQLIRAKRTFLLCEFVSAPILCDAFIDTAAPFSVIPFSYGQQVARQPVATILSAPHQSVASPLTWLGVPCDLAVTELRCVNLTTGVRSDPLRVLAKFPRRPVNKAFERVVVLGLSLVDHNDVRLVMERVGTGVSGMLTVM
jgi:hypothetical protein